MLVLQDDYANPHNAQLKVLRGRLVKAQRDKEQELKVRSWCLSAWISWRQIIVQ